MWFFLPIYPMNGWSYLTNGRSWLPLLCTTSRSIIIYHQSIIIYLTRYVNFSFIIPYVWSIILDQSMRFFSTAVIFFPSDMVSERSIVIYHAHKGGRFSPKSWNIFSLLPKHMCDRPSRISDFCSQVFIYDFLWNWWKSPNFCWKTQKNETSENDL